MEGVGRNYENKGFVNLDIVALLVEGVGRNTMYEALSGPVSGSPSSWRAWVEIVS